MTNQALAIRDDLSTMELGQLLAKSGYFSDAKEAGQAVVKVLAGRELGFGPIQSMTGINIIKGKVSMSANIMAAALKKSGRYDYRVVTPMEQRDERCEIVFYEGGEEIGRSIFTLAMAKRAGLGGDNWQKYPANMLFSRALSNGVKWYCPDLGSGPLYTPDELGERVDGETGEIIDAKIIRSSASPKVATVILPPGKGEVDDPAEGPDFDAPAQPKAAGPVTPAAVEAALAQAKAARGAAPAQAPAPAKPAATKPAGANANGAISVELKAYGDLRTYAEKLGVPAATMTSANTFDQVKAARTELGNALMSKALEILPPIEGGWPRNMGTLKAALAQVEELAVARMNGQSEEG